MQYFKKSKDHKKVQKQVFVSELFLLSSPVNHLTTPQIYLETFWRGPTPTVGWEPPD